MSEGTETSLVIEPDASRWGALVRGYATGPRASEMRRELGLPVDRRVIMTGHQAVFWHPGILAKYIAADAAARALDAQAAWVVVDHDTDDPWSVRYPARDGEGRLAARVFDLRGAGARREASGVAVCRGAAIAPVERVPEDAALPEVRAGLEAIRGAVAHHAGAANAARQVAGAVGELLAPMVSAAPVIFSTDLVRTTMFGVLLEAMNEDPRACVRAYNAAIVHAPGAGLRALQADEVNERYELPLWRIGADGVRRRVYAEELESLPRHELAPRALLMTALLRLGACDLFIHGTGGGLYEKANDAWMQMWFGSGGEEGFERLAPVAVVTATRRLALVEGAAPTGRDVARAKWAAHHARHDPAMLGDAAGGVRRRALVGAIKSARREGREPRRAFEALHEFLSECRGASAARLGALERDVVEVMARARDAEVASERTWAFAMYPGLALEGLCAEVAARFGGGA